MARIALAPGETGEVQISRQARVEGKWKTVPRGGDRVRARIKYKDHSGTYGEITAFAATKKAAEAKLQRAIDERLAGVDKLSARTLLVEVGRLWLDEIQRPDSGLSARSVDDYSRTFRRYVDARGSSIRGLTLTEADNPARITAFLREVADRHGDGSVKMTRSVLRHLFDLAVRYRALKSSPMRDVKLVRAVKPKETTRDTSRAFTREERDEVVRFAYKLAEEAESRNPRTARKAYAVADLVSFLAATGCRIEEARSLRWVDVDLESGSVIVRGTKTDGSYRQINLTSWVAERLQARAERVGTTGLVFAAPAKLHDGNETKWDQSNSANAINDLLRAAGFPWATSHTFRHSIITHLHESGVPLHKISDWAGHADVQTTARYLGRDLKGDKSGLAALL